MRKDIKPMVRIALLAAVYTVISLALAPFSFGNIQVRIAEALTLLPLLYKPSIWGLSLGCFLTNLLGALMGVNPTGLLDSVLGTLATFLAAYGTYYFRDKRVAGMPLLSLLCPVVLNFWIVGAELAYLYMPENVWLGTLLFGSEVAIGELIAVGIGYLVLPFIRRSQIFQD